MDFLIIWRFDASLRFDDSTPRFPNQVEDRLLVTEHSRSTVLRTSLSTIITIPNAKKLSCLVACNYVLNNGIFAGLGRERTAFLFSGTTKSKGSAEEKLTDEAPKFAKIRPMQVNFLYGETTKLERIIAVRKLITT